MSDSLFWLGVCLGYLLGVPATLAIALFIGRKRLEDGGNE